MPKLLNLFRRRVTEPDGLPDTLEFTAPLEVQAAKDTKKTVTFSLNVYNGKPIRVDAFASPVLVVLKGARFEKPVTPVIMDHDTNKRLGHTTRQTIDRRGIRAEGEVSSSMGVATGFVEDARSGFPFQVSLGASVDHATFIPEGETVTANGGEFEGPLIVADQVTIKELSVCVLGADSDTSVKISATRMKGNDMPSEMNYDLKAYRRQQAAEDLRISQIQDIAATRPHNETLNPQATGGARTVAEFRASAIENGMDPRDFELGLMRAGRPSPQDVPPQTYGSPGGSSHHLSGNPAKVIQAAMLMRAGYEKDAETKLGPQVMEAAHPFRSASLVDMARLALQASGMQAPLGRSEMLKAAISTNLLQEALNGGLETVVGAAFTRAPATWRSFASIKPLGSFREHSVVDPYQRGQLEAVGKDGEIKSGWLSEVTASLKLDTYAKRISISRQDFINDNLGIFDEISTVFASQAIRRVNNLVYATIMANGGSHFASGNGNYITDALTIAGLSAAVTKMRKQTDLDGEDLDIVPRVLVVPPELETTGRQILESIEVSRSDSNDNEPTGNALRSIATLEVESRLSNTTKFDNANAEQWYLFGGPESGNVHVGFLDGNETPTVETFGLDSDPNMLALSFRVYIDAACCLGNPRSGVYSLGDDSSV